MTQTSSSEEFQHVLPSNSHLIKASLFALLFGLLVLVTTILPAEYGIDPTGAGAALGLTQLSNPQEQPIAEGQNVISNTEQADGIQKHNIEIDIPAGTGLEYKFQILEGEKVQYLWQTKGEQLYFDLHGEPKGDTTGYFESYAESTAESMKGIFITPFEGSHGWYWENKGDANATVILTVAGKFEVIGIK